MKANLLILSLVVVGIINALPLIGVLSGQRIALAYDIDVNSPELSLLLRHRALLFGIIGGFVLASIVFEPLRASALIMAGISMVGFLVLMWHEGVKSDALSKIAFADGIGLIALACASVLMLTAPSE